MCGKCEVIKAKVSCVAGVLGVVSTVLAAVSRLSGFSPMHLGPRSFAAGAALMFLMSLSMKGCKKGCCDEGACDCNKEKEGCCTSESH